MTRLEEKSGFSSLLILILSSLVVVTTTIVVDLKLGQRLKEIGPEIFQQGPYPSVTPPPNSCSGKQAKDCCGTNGQCVNLSGSLVCYGCPSGGSCVAGKGCVAPEPTETCVTNGGVCFEHTCSSLNRSSVSGACSGSQFCCGSPLTSPTPAPECTAGQHKCTGDNFYSCYYGHWVPDGTCNGRGCKNSTECNLATECIGTQTRCKDRESNIKEFCSSGKWKSITCPYGCQAGQCKAAPAPPVAPECTGTESKCEGGNRKFCSIGKWITLPCPYGCETGECRSQPPQSACYCVNYVMEGDSCDPIVRGKPCGFPSPTPTTECTAGQHKCTGDNFYSCYYGHWVPDGNCGGQGCESDTKCNSPAPCTHGDIRCAGSNTKELCTYGAWSRSDCPYGCEGGECKPAPPLIPWIPVEPVGSEYVVGPSPAPITATQPLQINPYRDYCAGLTGHEYEDCRAADQAEAAMMAGMFGVPSALGLAGAAAITAPTWVPATLAAGGTAYAMAQPYIPAVRWGATAVAIAGGTAQTATSIGLAATEALEESGTITPSQAQPWYNALGTGFQAGGYALSRGSQLQMMVSNLNSIAGAFVSSSPIANQAYQVQTTEMEVRRIMKNLPRGEYTVTASEGTSYAGAGADQVIQSSIPGRSSTQGIRVDLENPITRRYIAEGVIAARQAGDLQTQQALGIALYSRERMVYNELVEQQLHYGNEPSPLSAFLQSGAGVCFERAVGNACIMNAMNWQSPQVVGGEFIRILGGGATAHSYHAQTTFEMTGYGQLVLDPNSEYVGSLNRFLSEQEYAAFLEIQRVTIGLTEQ